MIVRQLNQLCKLKDCFLYEGKIYEYLGDDKPTTGTKRRNAPKFRFMINEDDYDYVVDKKLEKTLLKEWEGFPRQDKFSTECYAIVQKFGGSPLYDALFKHMTPEIDKSIVDTFKETFSDKEILEWIKEYA